MAKIVVQNAKMVVGMINIMTIGRVITLLRMAMLVIASDMRELKLHVDVIILVSGI
jgi:hypothetical protein